METALNNSKDFCENDVVILWPNRCHIATIKDFIIKLKHTQPLIVTEAYLYDHWKDTESIYERNLDLFQEIYSLGLKTCPIFECNNTVNRNCYERDGVCLSNKGKSLLSRGLATYIRYHYCKNSYVTNDKHPNSSSSELKICTTNNDKNVTKSNDNNENSNFLCPRLTQASTMENQ